MNTDEPENDAATGAFTAAWGDAAALMVAAAADRQAVHAAVGAMVNREAVGDLTRTLLAALSIGGTLIEQECARADDGRPGPVLEYLVAASQHASELPRR